MTRRKRLERLHRRHAAGNRPDYRLMIVIATALVVLFAVYLAAS